MTSVGGTEHLQLALVAGRPDASCSTRGARVLRTCIVLDVATRAVQRLTEDPTDEYEPRWSRDGRWIYFVSTRSGRARGLEASGSGGSAGRSAGRPSQVTRQGGAAAFESADGRWLYYAKDTRPRRRSGGFPSMAAKKRKCSISSATTSISRSPPRASICSPLREAALDRSSSSTSRRGKTTRALHARSAVLVRVRAGARRALDPVLEDR